MPGGSFLLVSPSIVDGKRELGDVANRTGTPNWKISWARSIKPPLSSRGILPALHIFPSPITVFIGTLDGPCGPKPPAAVELKTILPQEAAQGIITSEPDAWIIHF